jgi:acyl-CoA dehydrogenase
LQRRFSDYAKETLTKVINFVEEECIPAEATVRPAEHVHNLLTAMLQFLAQVPSDPKFRWKAPPAIIEELKVKAKKAGLWNLFLSQRHYPKLVLFAAFSTALK